MFQNNNCEIRISYGLQGFDYSKPFLFCDDDALIGVPMESCCGNIPEHRVHWSIAVYFFDVSIKPLTFQFHDSSKLRLQAWIDFTLRNLL